MDIIDKINLCLIEKWKITGKKRLRRKTIKPSEKHYPRPAGKKV